MKNSPFIYGTTVSTQAFTNREKDAEKLYANLTNGINTMLISPRRWSKSSLVEKVIGDINTHQKSVKTVSIDLFSVGSESEFLELFARQIIKASSPKWQDWIKYAKEFFKQVSPKLSIGIDPGTDFSIGFEWEELKKHKDEILNLPERIAAKKNIRFIIALDEFQNLAAFENYEHLEKSMRACWQRHKLVTYCLYGSKRHMMADIFNNPSKPFYRFGDIMSLQKISREKWIAFIVDSFKQTGKQITAEKAGHIPDIMKDHSWYVQQLSHYTWQKTSKTAGVKEINTALNELIYANTPLYQKEVESLSVSQLNLMKAIAMGEEQLSASKTILKYKLGTSANVTKNKTILLNHDLIHGSGGKYEFLDPAFHLWFCKQYFGKEFLRIL